MNRRGKPVRSCISDTIREPSAPVVGYGKTWRAGGFACSVTRSAVRCTNRDGHGWSLSRARSTLF